MAEHGGPARLFVMGASRSGTTAMALLLNRHPDVCLGIERYKYKYLRRGEVAAEDFSAERFFDFRDGDTNIRPDADNRWAEVYRTMRRKWPAAKFVGDKIPHLFDRLPLVAETWPQARLVFMLRDPRRVASSWNLRAAAGKASWPAANDARRSVSVWNRAIRQAIEFRDRGMAIGAVRYERFFGGDPEEFAALAAFVGLADDEGFAAAWRDSCAAYEEIARKPLHLTPEEDAWVAGAARRDLAGQLAGLAAEGLRA